MRKAILVLVAALLSALCGLSTASAAGVALGPQVGYYRAKDADSGAFMYGLALRVKLLPALGVEGAVNYRKEDYGGDQVTVSSWPVTVTGLVYPVSLVYGAIGAGWYNTTFDYASELNELGVADQTHQKFGWHFGGGVEVPLAGAARIAADIRYVFLDYDFEELPGLGDRDSDFYTITVGLLFGF
jgi:opacity protein-like surface antigen